jgi:hypothetical protein
LDGRGKPHAAIAASVCPSCELLSNSTQEGADMDFIERILGISPDGGSGALEALLFIIPLVGIYLLYRGQSKKRKRTD